MPDPLEERVVASQLIHRGRYMEFRVDTIERADGSRGTRDVVGHPGAVAVLALDDADRLLMVRQWRVPAGRALLEIPAGTLDVHDGITEDPDGAARRELEEETGHRAATWRRLASFWTAPGFASELMHLYLATGIAGVGASDDRLSPDEDERLELRHVPLDEAVAMVEAGELGDAKSILGILWLDRLRRAAEGAGPSDTGSEPTTPGVGVGAVRISFGYTVGSLISATAATMRHQRFSQAVGVIALLIAAFSLLVIGDPVGGTISLVLGVLFLTGGLVVPFVWWTARKRTDLYRNVEVTIDDAGVRSNLPAGQGFMTWQSIEKIDRTRGWYFFHTAMSGVLAIPRRAVGPDELRELERIALRHGLTLDGHRVDAPAR
jgi:ADP-ribose pyrophosphatase